MNITDIKVIDPRRQGQYEDPFVKITVDEDVVEIGDPIYRVDPLTPELKNYRLIPCGPFFAGEFEQGTGHWVDIQDASEADIGQVNKWSLVKNQLIRVRVVNSNYQYELFMEVPRLRRLLRRNGIKWKILVDDDAALSGSLKWRIDHTDPLCYGGAVPWDDQCLFDPVVTILYRGAHLPVCQKHRRHLEHNMRHARVTANN